MDRPIRFKTRRGNTVFRQSYRHGNETKYSENYGFRVKRGARQYYFNLGPDKKEAAKKGDEIAMFLAVKSHTIEEALQLFCPDKFASSRRNGEKHVPSVKEFCDRYDEIAVHLSRTTIHNNHCALRRIAAHILGIRANGKSMPRSGLTKWREKVAQMPLSRLTPEQLLSFRNGMIRAAGANEIDRAHAITTTNSYLRCASSMFSEQCAVSYDDFIMPEPNPFSKVKSLPEPSHRYISNIDAIELADAAKNELKEKDPVAYMVFILALCCGMRRAEIDRLRWDQVDFKNRYIWIRTTSDKRPKAVNSEARIDAGQDVFDLLDRFRIHSITPPYVLPGSLNPTVRYRCHDVYRRLIPWLQLKGLTKLRTLHALRKEAGSIIYNQSGSVDLAADFLRNDPRTAREHYIGRKGRLELTLVRKPEPVANAA